AYLWGHMLIVGVVLWAFLNNMIHLNLRIVRKSVWVIFTLFLLSIIINNLFMKWMSPHPSNYFYTMTPEMGTPLELFYNLGKEISILGIRFNPIYIVCLLIAGLVVVFLFYGNYKCLKLLIIEKRIISGGVKQFDEKWL